MSATSFWDALLKKDLQSFLFLLEVIHPDTVCPYKDHSNHAISHVIKHHYPLAYVKALMDKGVQVKGGSYQGAFRQNLIGQCLHHGNGRTLEQVLAKNEIPIEFNHWKGAIFSKKPLLWMQKLHEYDPGFVKNNGLELLCEAMLSCNRTVWDKMVEISGEAFIPEIFLNRPFIEGDKEVDDPSGYREQYPGTLQGLTF